MDRDKLNYTIAEKIADIFQTYAHIILEQDHLFKKHVDVELIPKFGSVKLAILEDGKFTTEKEVLIGFKNKEEHENIMHDLRSIEKKLDENLKQIRRTK